MFNQGFGGGFLLNNNGDGGNQTNNRGSGNFNNNNAGGRYNNPSPNKVIDKKKGTMIPLTIKMLLDATDKPDDIFEINGVAVDQAIIVGRVYKIDEQSTRTVYNIDDTTGKIQIAYYKRTDGSSSSNYLDYKDNMYVKAVVVVKPFKGQKMYASSVIQPVTDYNQISYHSLSVMLAHAQRVKGPLPKPEQNAGGQQSTNNYNAGGKTNYGNRGGAGGNAGGNVQLNTNQDPMSIIRSAIEQICSQSSSGMCSLRDLTMAVKSVIQENRIKAFLIKLEGEGAIYSAESDDISNPIYGLLGN